MQREFTEEILTEIKGDVNRCYNVAANLISNVHILSAEPEVSTLSQFVLLKEALRMYLFAAYKIFEVETTWDNSLLDLYADIYTIAEDMNYGFVKMEGFACLDLSMKEADALNADDVEWFERSIVDASTKVWEFWKTVCNEAGVNPKG